MRNQIILGICLIIIALIIFGCDKSRSDWESAEKLNTIEAYNEFLSKHPQSKFVETARQKIDGLTWDRTVKDGTIEAYQEFLSEYPQSKFVETARQKMEELIWNKASKENTIEAYQRFLNEHPQNKFADSAKEKIEQIKKLEELKKKSNVRIVPFKDGYCSVEGPRLFMRKAGVTFEITYWEYKGKKIQILKPISKNAYGMPSISVQLLTKKIELLGPEKKLKGNDQKWNNKQQTLDFYFSDDTIQLVVHIYDTVNYGIIIKGIECFPSNEVK